MSHLFKREMVLICSLWMCLWSLIISFETGIPKPTNQVSSKDEYHTFSISVETHQIPQEHTPMRMEQLASNHIWIPNEWSSELFSYLQGLRLQQLIPHECIINTWSSACPSDRKDKQKAFTIPTHQTSELTVQGRGSTPFWSRRHPPVGECWDASPWGDVS